MLVVAGHHGIAAAAHKAVVRTQHTQHSGVSGSQSLRVHRVELLLMKMWGTLSSLSCAGLCIH
jgi:hypothetical protein